MTSGILRPEDIEYLNANFACRWEEPSAGEMRVVVKDYELPDGYNVPTADLMVMIPSDYPAGLLDMFYFGTELVRQDGRAIQGLSPETHFGRQWQRWSRHYAWQPGIDSLVSHIEYVKNELIHAAK